MSETIEIHTKRRQAVLGLALIDITGMARTVGIDVPVAITRKAHRRFVESTEYRCNESELERLEALVASLPGRRKKAPDRYLEPCTCHVFRPFLQNGQPASTLVAYFGPDETDQLAMTVMLPSEAETSSDTASNSARVVPLPDAPETGSPVPWLTSIHAVPGRGEFGDSRYPGNCSGKLIHDLLSYYRPGSVLDPMSGSGTCRDVAAELSIPCESGDLRSGFDATDAATFEDLGPFDFVWLHPPYWNLIRYSSDPRCLSNAKTLAAFLDGLTRVIANCQRVLARGGILGILMGDITRSGAHFGLPFLTFNVASSLGLRLAAPEIIRLSHGASSSRKSYHTSFIPRLHDVCLLLR